MHNPLNKNSLKIVWLLAFVAFALASCGKNQKFDRKLWDDGDGITFPERDGMLDDLIKNRNLKGKNFKYVVNLLRYPQRTGFPDSMTMDYEIIRKMDRLDTVYAKTLVIYLNKDSVVTDMKVYEKNNKEKLLKKYKEQNKNKKK